MDDGTMKVYTVVTAAMWDPGTGSSRPYNVFYTETGPICFPHEPDQGSLGEVPGDQGSLFTAMPGVEDLNSNAMIPMSLLGDGSQQSFAGTLDHYTMLPPYALTPPMTLPYSEYPVTAAPSNINGRDPMDEDGLRTMCLDVLNARYGDMSAHYRSGMKGNLGRKYDNFCWKWQWRPDWRRAIGSAVMLLYRSGGGTDSYLLGQNHPGEGEALYQLHEFVERHATSAWKVPLSGDPGDVCVLGRKATHQFQDITLEFDPNGFPDPYFAIIFTCKPKPQKTPQPVNSGDHL
jgi:hypothetical protein